MKKILLFLGALVLFSGCSNKNTLTCSLKEEQAGFKSESKIVLNFKDDKITDYVISTSTDIPNEYANIIDELFKSAKEPFKEYENLSGVTIDSKKSKKNIYVELSVNVKKIKERDKETLNALLDLSSNKKTIKNSFENQKYTCK